jgi:hypothetical protein
MKLLLPTLLLILLVSAVGVSAWLIYPSSRSNDIPNNGPTPSTTKTIKGKVVSVQKDTMILESGGKKVKIKSGNPVTILGFGLIKDQQIVFSDQTAGSESAVPGVAVPPEIFNKSPKIKTEFADFSPIPVGIENVSAFLELQKDGQYLAKRVSLLGN